MTERAAPRVLITGSTGFIGRRLVQRILADYGAESLVCLVHTPASEAERTALQQQRDAGVRLITGDLLSNPVAPESAPPIDVLIHLGANIDTNGREEDLRVNHEGTANLLDWIAPVAANLRIVYTSSVAVHDRDREPSAPISETSPLVSRTAYGDTKLRGERILQDRAERAGYSWTILRLPTVYGPGQKKDGLFEQMIEFVRGGRIGGRIDWPGRTSIIHVDDLADVIVTLAQDHDAAGEIYCIASDDAPTVGQLAQTIGEVMKRPVTPIRIPGPLLALVRAVVWNTTLSRLVPAPLRLPFWRLSLIVSDGFWFDASKFRRIYRRPLRSLHDGLAGLV